jgi:uncharacterized protein YndB with AHSA1/START domain
MTTLSLSRDIYCPIDEVFAYHTDLERAPQHWTQVITCRRERGPGAPEVGDRYAWRYRMYGVDFAGHLTVREVVPGRRFVWDTEGGLRASVISEYSARTLQRTRVSVHVDYDVPGGLIGRAVDRLLVESRNASDAERAMDRLVERLEAEVAARLDMLPI